MSTSTLAALAAEAAHIADPHGTEGERYTAVNSEANRSLYASRIKVYPKLVHGKYRKLKW